MNNDLIYQEGSRIINLKELLESAWMAGLHAGIQEMVGDYCNALEECKNYARNVVDELNNETKR